MSLLALYLDASARWQLRELAHATGTGYESRHAETIFPKRPWEGMNVSFLYNLRKGGGEEFSIEILHPQYVHSNRENLRRVDFTLSTLITHCDDIDPRITVSFPKNPKIGSLYRRLFGNESLLYEGLIYRTHQFPARNRTTSEAWVQECFREGSIEEATTEQRGFISQDNIIPFLYRLLERRGLPQRTVIVDA